MLRRHVVLTVLAITLATFLVMAGTASAHTGEIVNANCSSVSASFSGFHAEDQPIAFAVDVDASGYQTVAAVESPPGFVGSGTASADISSLTSKVTDGSLSVYAFWPDGRTETVTTELSCSTPPTTTTTSPPPKTVLRSGSVTPPIVVEAATPPPAVPTQAQPLTTG